MGYKQNEIAVKLGTTRQNVSLIEIRAQDNIERRATLSIVEDFATAATVDA